MTGESPRPGLSIRRLRIVGLTGAAPSAEAVREALARAFSAEAASAAASPLPGRLPHGATLADAAAAAVGAARKQAGRERAR